MQFKYSLRFPPFKIFAKMLAITFGSLLKTPQPKAPRTSAFFAENLPYSVLHQTFASGILSLLSTAADEMMFTVNLSFSFTSLYELSLMTRTSAE